MNKQNDLMCFSSISVSEPVISKKTAKAEITVQHLDGKKNKFTLMLAYDQKIEGRHRPLLRLAFSIPLLNYGLFSKKFLLQFSLSTSDCSLLKDLNVVFSRDIYVNKILRRRADFILPEFFPDESCVQVNDAEPKAAIEPKEIIRDSFLRDEMNQNSCGVLSSGGKDSLLTYGLLKEIGADVHPFYVNESGGHWRTAYPAYQYHKEHELNTSKVWTNIDRFYLFMLDNLKFIRSDHRNIRADTYAIQLCIFPFYIFALLPLFVDRGIGNLLLGSEFDDLRVKPTYLGIEHYFGVYDQQQDYDIRMNQWYEKRIPGLYQWSALRHISGLVDERILVSRYPNLAKQQRSCHSCHFENGLVVPCGTCSKCLGILLYLLANKMDPRIMNYRQKDVDGFSKTVGKSCLRLDEDEKNQSFYLLREKGKFSEVKAVDHVERIHFYSETCNPDFVPKKFREKILGIFEQYTNGYCKLDGETWVPMEKKEALSTVVS